MKKPKPNADLRKAIPKNKEYEKRCAEVTHQRIWVTTTDSGYQIGEYEVLQPRKEPSAELHIDALAAHRLVREGQATTSVPEPKPRRPRKTPKKTEAT